MKCFLYREQVIVTTLWGSYLFHYFLKSNTGDPLNTALVVSHIHRWTPYLNEADQVQSLYIFSLGDLTPSVTLNLI